MAKRAHGPRYRGEQKDKRARFEAYARRQTSKFAPGEDLITTPQQRIVARALRHGGLEIVADETAEVKS